MEFTYKLTEADYVKAARIRAKSLNARRPWSKFLSRLYLVLSFAILWLCFSAGRILEWLDLTGDKLGNLAVGNLLLSSILPTAILSLLIILLVRAVTYLPRRRLRREQYRNSAACQVETRVRVSPQSIAFQSETGSSESNWKNYATWNMRDGILVLTNHGGVRHILKIAGLDPAQHSELMGILSDALPQK